MGCVNALLRAYSISTMFQAVLWHMGMYGVNALLRAYSISTGALRLAKLAVEGVNALLRAYSISTFNWFEQFNKRNVSMPFFGLTPFLRRRLEYPGC